jgi:glutathione-independent formaldehyde dehydrogenase
MKAVIFEGAYDVEVREKDRPGIAEPTDALLRVTTAAICGSDLHMYDGRTAMDTGHILGHEIMGVIEQVGPAVRSIKAGDRVVLPFNIGCGFCFNCNRGLANFCLTVNPEKAHAAYGYAGMGKFEGGQTEYVRVPFADFNALKVPGQPFDEFEDDFILLADIFPTGYHATELAHVGPGSTVAVFGAGPVGLLSAYSALLKGAAEVYVVDRIEERLALAAELGATPIDVAKGNPVEQIKDMRRSNALLQDRLRPGEDKMGGVMCGIDAVGYQARSDDDYEREDAMQVINHLAKLVNPTGHMGLIGVYMQPDPGGGTDAEKQGIYPIPIGELWGNGITIGMGQCPVKRYNEFLRDLIIDGRARPGRIITHRIRIGDAPGAYAKFDKRADGYVKVLIQFR